MAGNGQDTYECDALVVGSGCAGMSAAVTAGHHGLNVLIVEKEPRFGGTTARSGGWLWIPGTSLARAWGIVESAGAGADLSAPRGRQQFRRRAGRCVPDRRTRGGRFLHHARPRCRFDMPLTFPDYHAEAPGGAQGGRSMVTRPFDGRELGPHIKDLGSAAARTHRVRHDARLRQGDHPFHARDEIADLGALCREAAVEAFRWT